MSSRRGQTRNIGFAVLLVGVAYVYLSRRGAAPAAGGPPPPPHAAPHRHTVPLAARLDREALRQAVAAAEAEEAARAAAAFAREARS